MKNYLLYAMTAIITVSSGVVFGVLEDKKNNTIRICTYNIRRMGSEKDPKNVWSNRKGLVFDMIHSIHPDIIGLQEATKDQLLDLQFILADYDSFGKPRSAKMTSWWQKFVMKYPSAKDEYNSLFYNKKKVKFIKKGHFGINPRGRIMTAHLPRICTWGLFRDINTGKQFYVYNTHLDNSSGLIRKRQVSMILKHVKKHTNDQPVILMGDLNMQLDDKSSETNIIKTKKNLENAGFVDAKSIAQKVEGPAETRTGWNNSELKMIDYILVKPDTTLVKKHVVVASPAGIFPSDHRPVYVDIVK